MKYPCSVQFRNVAKAELASLNFAKCGSTREEMTRSSVAREASGHMGSIDTGTGRKSFFISLQHAQGVSQTTQYRHS